MAITDLNGALASYNFNLKESERLIVNSNAWVNYNFGSKIPRFTNHHRHVVTELAFLRSFLAYEKFLQDSFLLYLLGKPSINGQTPVRYVFPPTRLAATKYVVPLSRDFASWGNPDFVINMADRCFKNGSPFKDPIKTSITILTRLGQIRNAIAHWSETSHDKFKSVVRDELLTYPPRLGIGGFLNTTMPRSSPPISFYEHYILQMFLIASDIAS